MKYPTLVVIIISLFTLTSCDVEFDLTTPSNEISTEREIQSIDALEVSGPFDVNIIFSDNDHLVTLSGEEQLIDRVTIEEIGSILRIRLEKNTEGYCLIILCVLLYRIG